MDPFRPDITQPQVLLLLKFEISRSEIEAHLTERALAWLNELSGEPEVAWANRNTLVLWVSGYDNDPRELYEIPEVCRFLHTIHSKWNYWFFFASQWDYTLLTLLACIYSAKKIDTNLAQFTAGSAQKFFLECTHAMNFLFDTWKFPEEENKALYFGARDVLAPVLGLSS